MYVHVYVKITCTCIRLHHIYLYHCTQVVLVDNARLKADIHKLKIENADLLRRVRLADCNVHHMRVSPPTVGVVNIN